MPYTVRTGKSEYPLVREMVQADQGSDLNVISLPLAETLGLDIRPLDEQVNQCLRSLVANAWLILMVSRTYWDATNFHPRLS